MKILIAEDDPKTREGLNATLQSEGYDTVLAADGNAALELFRSSNSQIACLDVMMPGMSGYDVCREIRKSDPDIPILFISAKSEEIDTVLGLELGADDFITKPFGVSELVARIRAVARRAYASGRAGSVPGSFTMRGLRIVPAELRAYRAADEEDRAEQPIELGPRDVSILSLLFQREGQAVDRDTFFDVCWGYDHMPNSRSLDQHISQLRKKIERDPGIPEIIVTVHGVGYRYES